MLKIAKTVLLAATLAAFGSNAFAGSIYDEAAEEVIVKGEILESKELNYGWQLLVEYRSKLYICSTHQSAITNDLQLTCRFIG